MAQILDSMYGNVQIRFNGYRYRQEKQCTLSQKVYWKCILTSCKGRAKTCLNFREAKVIDVVETAEHFHKPYENDHHTLCVAMDDSLEITKSLRKAAKEFGLKPVPQAEEIVNIPGTSDETLTSLSPYFENPRQSSDVEEENTPQDQVLPLDETVLMDSKRQSEDENQILTIDVTVEQMEGDDRPPIVKTGKLYLSSMSSIQDERPKKLLQQPIQSLNHTYLEQTDYEDIRIYKPSEMSSTNNVTTKSTCHKSTLIRPKGKTIKFDLKSVQRKHHVAKTEEMTNEPSNAISSYLIEQGTDSISTLRTDQRLRTKKLDINEVQATDPLTQTEEIKNVEVSTNEALEILTKVTETVTGPNGTLNKFHKEIPPKQEVALLDISSAKNNKELELPKQTEEKSNDKPSDENSSGATEELITRPKSIIKTYQRRKTKVLDGNNVQRDYPLDLTEGISIDEASSIMTEVISTDECETSTVQKSTFKKSKRVVPPKPRRIRFDLSSDPKTCPRPPKRKRALVISTAKLTCSWCKLTFQDGETSELHSTGVMGHFYTCGVCVKNNMCECLHLRHLQGHVSRNAKRYVQFVPRQEYDIHRQFAQLSCKKCNKEFGYDVVTFSQHLVLNKDRIMGCKRVKTTVYSNNGVLSENFAVSTNNNSYFGDQESAMETDCMGTNSVSRRSNKIPVKRVRHAPPQPKMVKVTAKSITPIPQGTTIPRPKMVKVTAKSITPISENDHQNLTNERLALNQVNVEGKLEEMDMKDGPELVKAKSFFKVQHSNEKVEPYSLRNDPTSSKKVEITAKTITHAFLTSGQQDQEQQLVLVYDEKYCKLCQTNFESENLLRDHATSQHPLSCRFCWEVLGCPKSRERHEVEKHIGTKNDRTYYRVEGKRKKKTQYRYPDGFILKCPLCRRTHPNERSLKMHHESAHPLTCLLCFQEYGDVYSRKKHVLSEHRSRKRTIKSLDVQVEAFLDRKGANRNLKWPWPCKLCGRGHRYTNYASLNSHVSTFHPNICSFCWMGYQDEVSLEIHMKSCSFL